MRLTFASLLALTTFTTARPAEGQSLLQTVAAWQYPGSALSGAEAADGATVDAKGDRTVASGVMKAAMTTDASVEDVLTFYKAKLSPGAKGGAGRPNPSDAAGRSVVFRDDSEGRPLALHTVLVNAGDTSTTLVISRGRGESKTHVAWTQYSRSGR